MNVTQCNMDHFNIVDYDPKLDNLYLSHGAPLRPKVHGRLGCYLGSAQIVPSKIM